MIQMEENCFFNITPYRSKQKSVRCIRPALLCWRKEWVAGHRSYSAQPQDSDGWTEYELASQTAPSHSHCQSHHLQRTNTLLFFFLLKSVWFRIFIRHTDMQMMHVAKPVGGCSVQTRPSPRCIGVSDTRWWCSVRITLLLIHIEHQMYPACTSSKQIGVQLRRQYICDTGRGQWGPWLKNWKDNWNMMMIRQMCGESLREAAENYEGELVRSE